MNNIFEIIGFIAAVVLPLWNIPLIVRIIKRKSSEDLSMWWVLGVWVCIILMFPAGVQSVDFIWRAFTITNTTFFTCVAIVALKYRKGLGKNEGR